MRVDVIGGGPAGLYFAILMKASRPDAAVEVVERNRADDTFGFGIVLSDETLANLRRADEPSYREIAANFAYWDDIYTHFKGNVLKSSGHGFSGIRRLTLLQILQRRAAALGVTVRFQTEDPGLEAHRGADLVVGADGINSRVRSQLAVHLQPTIETRPNRFVLARREDDAARLHLQLPRGQGGHLEPARLHVRAGRVHAGRRDHRRGVQGERPRRRGRAGDGRVRRAALRRGAEPRAGAHEPLVLAPVPGRALRALASRQRRAPRRRRAHRALLDRLRHEARARGRDRAPPGGVRPSRRRARGRSRPTRSSAGRRSSGSSTRPTRRLSSFENVRRFWQADPVQFKFA